MVRYILNNCAGVIICNIYLPFLDIYNVYLTYNEIVKLKETSSHGPESAYIDKYGRGSYILVVVCDIVPNLIASLKPYACLRCTDYIAITNIYTILF